MKRVCKKCKDSKLIDLFPKAASCALGYSWRCKSCIKNYRKVYNKNQSTSQIYKQKQVLRSLRYREKVRNNPSLLSEQRIYTLAAQKRRRATVKGNLDCRMSIAIRESLKKSKAGRSWETFVGYGINDLKQHLESLFTDKMTWEIFLTGAIHIDHKIPKSWFKYQNHTDPEFKICWSLNNLQPKWAIENKRKGNRLAD